ncbi:enoyl-CoA hydratase-related protein [Sedimenticola hydrogenitrophicus]|uniref:enoyl-CoA hydratase-related protein n=1 Tax=Sedimenticola hydrogenitrophicus TaxID=2967975 RepID=UPI0023AFF24E|nr:enoyl-CoA hydratase-related protein [Sedimenticola hydrogenitrophicus]
MDEVVRIERKGAVAVVTLDRPASLNALNREMSYQLRDGFMALSEDQRVRCVVLRGAGDHFMAGGDIGFFRQGLELPDEERKAEVSGLIGVVHQFITILREMPQPVIAGVRGSVAGFGMSLVAAADLAIAADSARFTQAYSQIGTTPDGGNTWFLPRAVGTKRAMGLTLLNEPIDAAGACAIGLVNQVVADSELEAVTLQLAERLARGPTRAYAQAKRLINEGMSNTLEQQLLAEQGSFTRCALSHDFAEGVTAFMEKRRPEFSGE